MLFFVPLLGSLLISYSHALDNDVALTPPMGWITRDKYGCSVDCAKQPNNCVGEKMIKQVADKMLKDGWIKAGYHYLILEECWSAKTRDPKTQELVPDKARFKEPLTDLSAYLHSRNLKLGLTLGSGKTSCLQYPGSEGYLKTDAKTMAKWGVDYVKMTSCNTKTNELEGRFESFSKYLVEVGCQIAFSCTYPVLLNWKSSPNALDWKRLQNNCNTWRLTEAVEAKWDSILNVINDYRIHNNKLVPYAKPGSWNDPDVLLVGNNDLTEGQQRVQMGMWSMFAAPLIMVNDLCSIKNFSANLLKNEHLIGIDQDKGGHQAEFIKTIDTVQLWKRQLSDEAGGLAIALLNVGKTNPVTIQITLSDFQLKRDNTQSNYYLFDVMDRKNLPCTTHQSRLNVTVKPMDILIYKILRK